MFFFTIAFTISACSGDIEVAKDSNNQIEKKAEKSNVHVNRILTMEVEGMVCKMGCGGAIRKGLKETLGVSEVQFDFKDDRASNTARVSFDKNIISADEMVKVVTELNEGQFKVGSISFESLHETTFIENKITELYEESALEMTSSQVEIPNLLDLFSVFLTH
jgi:copper chaperone CopZ